MSLNPINEALAEWDKGFRNSERIGALAEAARAYVRDWVTCPTCNGSKFVGQHTFNVRPCPDCVDGMTPSPEAMKRLSANLFAIYSRGREGHAWDDSWLMDFVRASREGETR